MIMVLDIRKKDGEHLAAVSVLENGTTVVTYPYGSTHVDRTLHALLHELVEEHGEVRIVARHRVG